MCECAERTLNTSSMDEWDTQKIDFFILFNEISSHLFPD